MTKCNNNIIIIIKHQKRDQENENTDFGKLENNKHLLKESSTQLRIS